MKGIVNYKIWTWLILLILHASFGYSQISFRANTSSKKVVSGAYFTVEFELKNARGTNFEPPVFRGFSVISGPSSSQSTTIINGRRTSSVTYSYTLMADKPGRYIIPPAFIKTKRQEFRSNKVHMTVVKTAPKKEGDEVEAFVKVEMDTTVFYVGQQIIVSLKLYTTISIMNYDVKFDPALKDMSKTMISTNRPQQKSEVYEGKQYATYVIRKMAFYPQRTGHYIIPKAFVSLGIKTGNRRRSSFFFNSADKHINVNTDAIPIDVVPLPKPTPSTFNGAIGNYSSRFRINKTRLSTDQAFSLFLDIQGDGDIKISEAPILNFGEGLEVYEPKLKLEKQIDQVNKIRFKKQYEYLITPTRPGVFNINPRFSYFNPDSLKFITRGSDTFKINVSKGFRTGIKGSGIDPNKPLDLADVHPLGKVQKPVKLFFGTTWYWLLFTLPLLGLIGGWFVYNGRMKEENMDPLLKKKKYALELANKHLQLASSQIDTKDGSFYKAIQQGVLGYLSDKLNLKTTDLSKNNVHDILNEQSIQSSLIDETMKLMNDCEMALYGGSDADNKTSLYNSAVNLIGVFEEKI